LLLPRSGRWPASPPSSPGSNCSPGRAIAAPTRRLILARPVLDFGSLQPAKVASAAVRASAASLGLDQAHGVRVQLTGEVPIADEEFATLAENIGAVAMVMLAAMLLTLWLATRSVKLVVAIFATIVLGLVVTTAVGLAAIGRLNLISVAFIPLFVGLGVDFGIQIAVRFNAERSDGLAPAEALRAAATALGAPLLLAAGAVFLGFGAFLPTAYIGIAELGVIAGLGMVIALLFSVTLLPALILLLRPGKPLREVGFAQLAPADRWLATHRRAVLWAFGVSLAASIALLPWVVFDFNPFHLRDQRAPAMAALTDLTRDPNRTLVTIDVLTPNVSAAEALAPKLSALPEVRQVISADSFVPADQPAKLALIQDASTLLDLTLNPFDIAPAPNDAELVSALAASAAQLRAVAGAGQGKGAADARRLAVAFARLAAATPAVSAQVNDALAKPLNVMLDSTRAALGAQPVTRDTLPPELVRDWIAPDGRARLSVYPAGNANDNRVVNRFREAVQRVAPNASGFPVSTQAAGSTVAGAFVQAGVIAFVLVSLLLLLVLRNVREVLFTLAPVVLSIFLTLGSCVVIGQPLNFANIIAFPLLFGVGVAFHIYFVMAWRAGAHDLLQSSLARAVLFSALATGTAFGSLWLSDHPGTASMGKILLISLAWTLVCALVFEPALLGPAKGPARKPAA
jgi:hopanoid biosynthesis associated RND transporter like protein HpnN